MKQIMSCLTHSISLAAICWVSTVPGLGVAGDRNTAAPRVAPLGIPIQQANYSNSTGYEYSTGNGNCPNGDCQTNGVRTWNGSGWGGRIWGNGLCPSCGLFGCRGCQHGLAAGNAWVRPPAVWPVARTPNTYQYYWSPQLGGMPVTPVAYPMIYHPTDTTQLGFSYRHVPRWGYRPEMLPPAPTPYWPMGLNSAYGNGWVGYAPGYVGGAPGPVVDTVVPVTPAPAQAVPVVPAKPGVVVPPPPADPEAAVFPNRARG